MEVSTMARKTQSPEEKERRAKIRELLQAANVSSIPDFEGKYPEAFLEYFLYISVFVSQQELLPMYLR